MRFHPLGFRFASVLAATMCVAGSAFAACDVPLSVSQSSGRAKVLIILDSSGSMNEAIVADGYDAGLTYTGNFTSTRTYNVSADGTYEPNDFNTAWPASPSAYLVASDQGEAGQYNGNYLNWVYFHATAAERGTIPAMTRIQMAKQAVNTVVAGGSGVDYGVMIFNGDAGGRLLAPIGTNVDTLQLLVNSVHADSYTPLAETMVTALNYFSTPGASAPFQASCEKAFIVLATDGYPTKDLDVPAYLRDADGDGQDPGTCTSMGAPYADNMECSGYLDDVAYWMYRNDLRSDLPGTQNVTTFVIGCDLDAPILQSAAAEGGGAYFSVSNPTSLANALATTFNLIAAQMAASGAVSVVASEDRTNNRMFRARFESQTWKGFVESYALPYSAGDAPVWEAGALLRSRNAASRNIYTSSTGTDKAALVTASAASFVTLLGAADQTEASQIIDYTRGNAVTGTRDRGGWKLGDVIDAAPVMVTKPQGFKTYLGYSAFRAANAGRAEALYVAANDGMIHCLNPATGDELWGYVPKSVLPQLRTLMSTSYCHNYFVNMQPVVGDMYLGGSWKTVLIGGQERGGNGLFALDVTDPTAANFNVLWDVSLPQLKGSWNAPTLVRDRTRNGHLLAVGTGYDVASAQASLLAINPNDGSVVTTFALGSAVSGNKTTRASAIDKDYDGYDDLLYLGDLAGRMWRVNLATSPWTVTLLYNCGQPITAAPVLTLDSQGRVMVFFGTGRFMSTSDLSTTSTQSFYGLIDDNSGSTIATADLVDQSSSISSVTGSKKGWYVNLTQASGERITRRPALVNGTLYVPSFRPSSSSCSGNADAYLYSLDYKDGSAPSNANGTENNVTSGRVSSQGTGMLSDPIVDLVNEDILIQSSNTSVVNQGINAGLKKLVVRSWRQKWN